MKCASSFRLHPSSFDLVRLPAAAGAVALEQVGVGAGDDVGGDELADAAGGLGAGVHRRLHAADVAADDRRNESAADLDGLHHLDVGGLAHRVGRLDEADPALGLDHAEGLAVAAISCFCHDYLRKEGPRFFKPRLHKVRPCGHAPKRRYLRADSPERSARRPPTGCAAGFLALGIIPPSSSWGRAMTWTLM